MDSHFGGINQISGRLCSRCRCRSNVFRKGLCGFDSSGRGSYPRICDCSLCGCRVFPKPGEGRKSSS